MPRRAPSRALADRRPYLVLSVVAALAFYYMRVSELPEVYLVPIKGSAVGFLALYAWMRHSSKSAHLLAGALVAAAIGDMAIEFGLIVGGAAFFVSHVIMITMLIRHRRPPLESQESIIFIALLLGTPFAAYFLPYDESLSLPVAIYALALGGMAAGAWASDFPRMRVAAGAILFVISDMLIFAGAGAAVRQPHTGISRLADLLPRAVLLTVGVITTLRKRDPELRVVHSKVD